MRRDIEVVPAHLADLLLPLPPGVYPISGGWGPDAFVYIALAASLASAAVGTYGAYASSQQQAGAYEYNAVMARSQALYQQQLAELQGKLLERQALGSLTLNEAQAAIAEQQAVAAQAAGDVRAAGIRRNYERTQSEIRAAIGKSGVDTTGSPLLVLMENADTVGQELALNEYQTALDVTGAKTGAAYSRLEGQLRADSLRTEAGYARFGGLANANASLAQANLFGYQAGGARQAGMYNVGSTLLSGAASAGSPFLRYGSASSSSSYAGRGDHRY